MILSDKPAQWTEEQAFAHLRETFDLACKVHPDLMEPYIIRLADGGAMEEQRETMRAALRETFRRRYP